MKKMRLKVSSAKRRPFCLGLNVLTVGAQATVQYMYNVIENHPFQITATFPLGQWVNP